MILHQIKEIKVSFQKRKNLLIMEIKLNKNGSQKSLKNITIN